MNVLCEYYGGSHSYGLNTPSSDIDIRGVFKFDTAQEVVNPGKDEAATKVCTLEHDNRDSVHHEFRHFLNLLRKGNPQTMEITFNTKWLVMTPIMEEVIAKRKSLIDPVKFRNATEGYAMGEYNLAIGNRKGKIGGKRNEAVVSYGFSPKNFVNLFRILYCAEVFFNTGELPVNIGDSYIYPQLMELKLAPDRFTRTRLEEMYDERLSAFSTAWISNSGRMILAYSYKENVATDLILKCYKKELVRTRLGRLFS